MLLSAPISVGELFDKLSILYVKAAQIKDPLKSANIARERKCLQDLFSEYTWDEDVLVWFVQLQSVNRTLWLIEDQIRICERRGDFGATFVDLARQVYQQNDKRAELKYQINIATNSELVEEKSYTKY